jgi:hypothetical protein
VTTIERRSKPSERILELADLRHRNGEASFLGGFFVGYAVAAATVVVVVLLGG